MKRKTNKHRLGLAPRTRREKFVTLLCSFLWAITSVYQSEITTQPPGTLTHPLALANPASVSTDPSSLLSSRLSLTSVDCSVLLTAFCSLPWDLAFLVFFRSRNKASAQLLCVGFAPKRAKESSDWHSFTSTETNGTFTATHTHTHTHTHIYMYVYIYNL